MNRLEGSQDRMGEAREATVKGIQTKGGLEDRGCDGDMNGVKKDVKVHLGEA